MTVDDGEGAANLREGTLGEDTVEGMESVLRLPFSLPTRSESRLIEKGNLHQQTGLTAGTITNDNELATDLGHLEAKEDQQTMKIDKRIVGESDNDRGKDEKQLREMMDGWAVGS